MKEVDLLKKLHDSYQRYCQICGVAKHVQKFKRKGWFYKSCNECFLEAKKDVVIKEKSDL